MDSEKIKRLQANVKSIDNSIAIIKGRIFILATITMISGLTTIYHGINYPNKIAGLVIVSLLTCIGMFVTFTEMNHFINLSAQSDAIKKFISDQTKTD